MDYSDPLFLVLLSAVLSLLASAGAVSASQYWASKRERSLYVIQEEAAKHERADHQRHEIEKLELQWSADRREREARWLRDDELAEKHQRQLATDRLWDRWAGAYESILKALGEVERQAIVVIEFSDGWNRDNAEEIRGNALERIREQLDALQGLDIYLSEPTISTIEQLRGDVIRKATEISRYPGKTEHEASLLKGLMVRSNARKAATKIRAQGLVVLQAATANTSVLDESAESAESTEFAEN